MHNSGLKVYQSTCLYEVCDLRAGWPPCCCTPSSCWAAPATAEMLWKVQMQDALPAGYWPGMRGSRLACLLTLLQAEQGIACSQTKDSLLGRSCLGLTINGPFKVVEVSHWKGHPMTPPPHLHRVVLPQNSFWLPAGRRGTWAAVKQRWGWCFLHQLRHSPQLTLCNEAVVTPV